MKYNISGKYMLLRIITITLMWLVLFSPHAVCKKKTYKIIIPVHEDLKVNFISQYLNGMKGVLEDKLKVGFIIKEYKYSYLDNPFEKVLDLMNQGKYDFAFMFPVEYHYYMLEHETNAVPLFALQMFGKKHGQVCAYTRKKDNITNIKQLKGKTWGGVRTRNPRFLLYKNNIDLPVNKYFGKTVYLNEFDVLGLAEKLQEKEIDFFTFPKFQADLFLNNNKKHRDMIRECACVEYMHTWLVVGRKEIPRKLREQIRDLFFNMHKDPDFAKYRYFLRIVEGKFVDVTISDIYETMKIAVEYKNNGWLKEEMAFIKANFKKGSKKKGK